MLAKRHLARFITKNALFVQNQNVYQDDEFWGTFEQPVNTEITSVEELQGIRIEELKDFGSDILQTKLENQKLKLDNKTMEMALVKIELALRPPLGREKEVFQAGEIQFNDSVRLFAEGALAEVGGKK